MDCGHGKFLSVTSKLTLPSRWSSTFKSVMHLVSSIRARHGRMVKLPHLTMTVCILSVKTRDGPEMKSCTVSHLSRTISPARHIFAPLACCLVSIQGRRVVLFVLRYGILIKVVYARRRSGLRLRHHTIEVGSFFFSPLSLNIRGRGTIRDLSFKVTYIKVAANRYRRITSSECTRLYGRICEKKVRENLT